MLVIRMVYYIKEILDTGIVYTRNEADAANGRCLHPEKQERFAKKGNDFWETGGIYQKGEPPKQGYYYDCIDKDGNEVRLQWFVCSLNAKKRYYKTGMGWEYFGTVDDGIRHLPETGTFTKW